MTGDKSPLSEAQIKHLVDRFLGWKLPEDFRPDGGVQFDADAAKKLDPRNLRYAPYGTNLLDATQADAMVRHMIEGLPLLAALSEPQASSSLQASPSAPGGGLDAWRPIETAPKDETFIDVCDRHGNRSTDVKWNTGRKRWEVWAGSWEADWTELSPPPVCWMPIPATPKEPS